MSLQPNVDIWRIRRVHTRGSHRRLPRVLAPVSFRGVCVPESYVLIFLSRVRRQ
jgi:hypothetical protein